MPRTLVLFYKDREGNVPVLEWLDALPARIQDKCVVKIERLRERGHEPRRPEGVLAHGLTKEREVPVKDIERALERKRVFEQDPAEHTYREG